VIANYKLAQKMIVFLIFILYTRGHKIFNLYVCPFWSI